MTAMWAEGRRTPVRAAEQTEQENAAQSDELHNKPESDFWTFAPFFEKVDSRSPLVIPRAYGDDFDQVSRYFQTAGRVLGLSIKQAAPLGVRIPKAVWAIILGREPTIEECLAEDPVTARSLRQVLALENEEELAALDLTFAVPLPGGKEAELKPGGAAAPVTLASRGEYARLFARRAATRGAEREVAALRLGLTDVVPPGLLAVLHPAEIYEAVAGPDTVDLARLERATEYVINGEVNRGSGAHPLARAFWEVAAALAPPALRALLRFWSGSAHPPFAGADREEEVWTITFDHSDNPSNLPQATTCDRNLFLPPYKSKEELKKKLLMAMEFGAAGFDPDRS
uniref:HECT-type E3 ubiquitin transferase n=1 Tax=Heterosigma akashiwo TaxID=2829 RepID=A0A7S3UXC4_HETAK